MAMLVTVLIFVAFVLFLLSAIQINSPRVNLQSAGLACLTLALLLTKGLH